MSGVARDTVVFDLYKILLQEMCQWNTCVLSIEYTLTELNRQGIVTIIIELLKMSLYEIR